MTKFEIRNKLQVTNQQLKVGGLVLISSFVIGCWSLAALALSNPEEKVVEAIKGYIVRKNPDWSRDEIRLELKAPEKELAEIGRLAGDCEITVVENYPDFRPVGSVIFPLAATRLGTTEVVRKFLLRAKVEVIKSVIIARQVIKKGKTLAAEDFQLAERDVALLPKKYFDSDKLLIGQEAKITIPQNSTIFEWMVGALPLFRRGEQVDLVVVGPALAVKVKAQALDEGYLGSEIRVKRQDLKKILTGRVISSSEVEVKL